MKKLAMVLSTLVVLVAFSTPADAGAERQLKKACKQTFLKATEVIREDDLPVPCENLLTLLDVKGKIREGKRKGKLYFLVGYLGLGYGHYGYSYAWGHYYAPRYRCRPGLNLDGRAFGPPDGWSAC